MKRVYITTVLTCLVILAAFIVCFRFLNLSGGRDTLKIGFIYDNDESTPYTYNFSLAKDELAQIRQFAEEYRRKKHTGIV